MERFVKSVEQSLEHKNWYSALTLELMLPDMCAANEKGSKASWREYASWFDKWVGDKYKVSHRFINEDHANDPDGYIVAARENGTLRAAMMKKENVHRDVVYLSGTDCYCLRCSLAHEASDEITGQRIRDTLDQFILVYPSSPVSMHNNHISDAGKKKLQLQVDIFCTDICDGVAQWQKHMEACGVALDMSRLMTIRPSSVGF
ncbi:hypothetical protein [Methylorubrum populi]